MHGLLNMTASDRQRVRHVPDVSTEDLQEEWVPLRLLEEQFERILVEDDVLVERGFRERSCFPLGMRSRRSSNAASSTDRPASSGGWLPAPGAYGFVAGVRILSTSQRV